MTNNNFSGIASFIWSVADLLRGDFKQSQYGRIILPFTLLRRLECVLENSKEAVLTKAQTVDMALPEESIEKQIKPATKTDKNLSGLQFYNLSKLSLQTLGEQDIKANLSAYIQGFSKDAREIFEHFNFMEFVGLLDDANLLYKIVQRFANTPLSPSDVSNHEMGLIFEELIRRFAESSNETAGEHFTPRDIVRLTTSLVFMEDNEVLTQTGKVRTLYDPTAGTGGFLSSGMEYVYELNPKAVLRAFGQELNPESYAICKADMLIKGQPVDRIKLGNTLSNDQLASERFDYMLSNPPFGVDWKKIEDVIKTENITQGYNGRFGAGLPRVSDGSLLFLMHLISKMRLVNPQTATPAVPINTDTNQPINDNQPNEQSSRIGIILNGSPLFTGSAGSGESEIRRYLFENDYLEGIVALPTDMFYNTGIATYIWILSNKKTAERQGKVQLVDATNLASKMRKSLGSKRNFLDEQASEAIIRCYGAFENGEQENKLNSKIFDTHAFGYRRVTIERPLRLSAQFTDKAIASLRFNKSTDVAMMAIYEKFGQAWQDDADSESNRYGDLSAVADDVRVMLKADFSELKEKQIKDLLDPKTWLSQRNLVAKGLQLKNAIGTDQFDDFNAFSKLFDKAIKDTAVSLDKAERKQILDAVKWKNPDAQNVIKKVHKKGVVNPMYGLYQVDGDVVEYDTDSDLRDYENIALDPSQAVTAMVEAYVIREVLPHVADAWIGDKRDDKDGELGVVGYEIPFNRHFYVYEPPRELSAIDADLDAVSREIMALLSEVKAGEVQS